MININTTSDVPIYTQIRNEIIREIANGNLKNGDELPSVRQFANDLGINPMTISKAYNILKDEKIIVIDRRVGAKICVDECYSRNSFEDELKLLLMEAKIRGKSQKDIKNIVEEIIKWCGNLFYFLVWCLFYLSCEEWTYIHWK